MEKIRNFHFATPKKIYKVDIDRREMEIARKIHLDTTRTVERAREKKNEIFLFKILIKLNT